MEKDSLRKLRENEQHWGHGSFSSYFCKQDPRLFVPKRSPPGTTLNFAHAFALPIVLGIITLLVMIVYGCYG